MRLRRITKIKQQRVFRDFTWPSDLPAFAQYNVFYGWNGSGKTTLAHLFCHLENRQAIDAGEVEFELESGAKISGAEISTTTIPPVRVFNRDFVAKTLESIDTGNVSPIYFLGESSIEKQKEVQQLRKDLDAAYVALKNADSARAKADKALDDFCIEKAKLIKEALLGSANYANYDKRRLKHSMQQLQAVSPQPTTLTDTDKERLRKQKDLSGKARVDELSISPPDLVAVRSDVVEILGQSLASQVLDELANDAAVSTWVQQGLALHQGERETNTCRFCGNTLGDNRRAKLEAHFNDAFAAFQREIEQRINDVGQQRATLSAVPFPDTSRFYDHLVDQAHQAIEAAKTAINSVTSELACLQAALEIKKAQPFESVAYDEQRSDAGAAQEHLRHAIDAVNGVIREHEKVTINLTDMAKKACETLEQDYVLNSKAKFEELSKTLAEGTNELSAAHRRPAEIQAHIDTIEREIVEHRRPAEELNRELAAYLGRDDLTFEVAETGYRLSRDGHAATHLSEGERTAIAFLYFLKSLEDKAFDITMGIVVIDDPVSSLDANALFSAFGYMKDRTRDCRQLFVLTHNFTFFRQVKNWFHHLKGQNKKKLDNRPARFYTLVAPSEHGTRNASVIRMDPLLEQYDSEYHYLFRQVHDAATAPVSASGLAQHYGMPNVARRLIEIFLAYRVPDASGELFKRMDRIEFDTATKTRILRFLNTYSHAPGISDPEHDLSVLAETREVLRLVLELMKAVDVSHYEGMERLVLTPEAEDE